MSEQASIPRVLIVDDLFGRTLPDRRNEERASLCAQFLLRDVTGDEEGKGTASRIKKPLADAVFCRGQTPRCASVGDVVECDLEGTLHVVRDGWIEWRPDRPRWAMVLLDLCFYTGQITEESHQRTAGMPEARASDDDAAQYFGLRLLKALHEEFPDLPVVILSSKPREAVSRDFSQYGALAFLPRADEKSPELLREYIWRHGLIPDESGEIVGHSKALLLALRAARRAAADRHNILIRGERGTGKELFARYINRQSSRQGQRKLVDVDSGRLSPQLYASEMFGHVRGAYTGATDTRPGRIIQANGGDLFLDEIGNMPSDVQVGLLRVLQDKMVIPLGAERGEQVDVRFISATNEDLEGKAAAGGFRQDLLDRLRDGGTVFLRPLQERLEDLDRLVESLVRASEKGTPGAMTRRIEPEAIDRMRAYDWPGNIRELQSCILHAVRSYPDVEHLFPVHLQIGQTDAAKQLQPAATIKAPLLTATPETSPALPSPPRAATGVDDLLSLLSEFSFDQAQGVQLVGKLPAFQEACARLLAGLLRAALQATAKPTPEQPAGEILIHPAMKLITGDSKLTAVKAADQIKRLLSFSPEVAEQLLADPLLKEAYETSIRLRPKQPKKADRG